ncbi:MAG TPA: type II secretion system major pseudopilin GspG [Candidatus Saccharimonadia bacterium]|nr:type II secretion system major pseudopilin GspG [Candidatus Saccharimonadia bacterium]
MDRIRRARGFTLIEIVIAVAILAILAAIVIPRVAGRVDDARVARAKSDVQALVTALNLYKLDNYQYPSTEQGLEALVAKPGGQPEARNWKQGGYIDRLPKDPWGSDYQYISPGQHGEIDVYSLGADAQLGGEGPGADVGNWTD